MTKEEKRKAEAIRQMNILKCSYEEAYQIVLDDEAVDRGEPLPWDLTPEQLKESKKARQADRTKPKEKVKRERKANENKQLIIADLLNFFQENEEFENVEVLNAERQIAFTLGGKKYELTLVEKREKKA
jgi:hypothetical protein